MISKDGVFILFYSNSVNLYTQPIFTHFLQLAGMTNYVDR